MQDIANNRYMIAKSYISNNEKKSLLEMKRLLLLPLY